MTVGDPRRQPGRLHVPQGRHGAAVDGEEPALDRRRARGRATPCRSARRRWRARARDVTVVTLSLSVHHALDVAEKLAADGHRRRGARPAQPGAARPRGDPRRRWPRPAGWSSSTRTTSSFGLSGEVVATVTDARPGACCGPRSQRVAVPGRADPLRPRRSSTPCCRARSGSRQAVRRVVGQMTDVLFPAAVQGDRRTPRGCSPRGSSRTATTRRGRPAARRGAGRQGGRRGAGAGGRRRPPARRRGGRVVQGAPIARID